MEVKEPMSDYLIPLGGGDEVGASAYFLFIDGIRILLDCGARLQRPDIEELYPDYERLLQEVSDYSDLDLILISHAHYDHIGSFAKIATLAPHAEILATQDTKRLIEVQLLEFGRISGREESERVKNERYRQAQTLLSRIQVRPVMKTFQMKGCKITLLPAGHMIGAVMIYLETGSHRILYSGDFSVKTRFGLNGMRIPGGIFPKVLLLNAPNTYLDADEWQKELILVQSAQREGAGFTEGAEQSGLEPIIKRNLAQNKRVYLISKSIPKHLDLLYFLNEVFPDTPVFLEPKSRKIADTLADMGYFVYGNHIQSDQEIPENQGGYIVVGQDSAREGCVSVLFDLYSLHAGPAEIYQFAENLGVEQIYLLHVYPRFRKKSLGDVMKENHPNLSVTQAKNGFKYYIKREKAMKYDQIFQDVMQKELSKAQELQEDPSTATIRAKLMGEWVAVYGSLRYPNCHPRDAYRMSQEVLKENRVSYETYMEALESVNLDQEERRKYILGIVEQGISWLKQALDGDREAMQKYAEFTENLERRDRKNHKIFFLGKYMVIFLVMIDPDLKNETYSPILYTFRSRYCDRLLRNIRGALFEQYGMKRQKKSARDVLRQTERVLTESSEAVAEYQSGNELEQLRFMKDNYKNSLELVQAMFDELNETIDEATEDAKNTAIASFYSMMNSEKYGHLLDSMEMVEKRLTTLKEQKVKTPPQLLPLTIVFKQMLRFIKDCGVTPIDCTGREFETEVEGLAEYTYIGESYTELNQKKTVVVEHPGWKFGSTVISLPTVREKEEEVE